jgi:hypothetical protein
MATMSSIEIMLQVYEAQFKLNDQLSQINETLQVINNRISIIETAQKGKFIDSCIQSSSTSTAIKSEIKLSDFDQNLVAALTKQIILSPPYLQFSKVCMDPTRVRNFKFPFFYAFILIIFQNNITKEILENPEAELDKTTRKDLIQKVLSSYMMIFLDLSKIVSKVDYLFL